MPDLAVTQAALDWELKERCISAQLVGLVYSYMKTKYEDGATLEDMERIIGIAKESISQATRALEDHGYLSISRATKPFRYMVIK